MKRIGKETLKEANIFIDGRGHLGVTKSFALPAITEVMTDDEGALKGKSDTGIYEALELTFKIEVLDSKLYAEFFGANKLAQIPLVLKESIHQTGGSGKPLEVILKGKCESITLNEDTSGAVREVSVKMWCDTYILSQNNEPPMITYDRNNYIFNAFGVDLLAQTRSDLSM